MKSTELSKKTVAELRVLAKKRKVDLPAGAKRADIVRALIAAGEGAAAADKRRTPIAAKTKAKTTGKAKGKERTQAATRTTTSKASAKTKSRTVKSTTRTAGASPKKPAKKVVPKRGAVKREQKAPAGARELLAAQERIEDAKFYTGPPERQHPSMRALPVEYGKERVALLARDPDTVFCYWEVPAARLDKERARQGKDSRLCVRIYDVTGIQFDGTNATSFFDQEVYERVGSWYFDLRRPAHAFCADIGLRTRGGQFRTISRSNILFTPPGGVSDVADEEWSLMEQQLLRLFGVTAERAGGVSSEQLREWFRLQRGAAISSPGVSSWAFPGSGKR